MDRITHAWIRIHLQPHTSIEDILVQWLEWLTAKQAIYFQSLVKRLEAFGTSWTRIYFPAVWRQIVKNYEKLIHLFCGEHSSTFTPLYSYTPLLLHSFNPTPAQLILEACGTSWSEFIFRPFPRRLGRNVVAARLIISAAFTFCSLPSHPIGTEEPVQVKYTAVPLMFTWLEKIVCLCGHNCLKKLNILIIWCFLYWQKTSNFLLNFGKSKILTQPFQLCLYVSKRHAGFSHSHRNANIGIFVFTAWKQKIQWQNVIPSGNRTQASHNLWFQVQHSPFYINLTCAA